MTDREMLERAAKAAGVALEYRRGSDAYYYDDPDTGREQWHPQDDDRQALWLAVKLHIGVRSNGPDHWDPDDASRTIVLFDAVDCPRRLNQPHDGDPYAATRRAITRAAASIGESLSGHGKDGK